MKRQTLPSLVLLVLFFAQTAPLVAASFMLAPPRVEMTLRAGATENVILTVLTSVGEGGEGKMYFRFYVVDFKVDTDGQVAFFEAGSLKRSASTWINLESTELQLQPNQKKKVQLTVRVPSNASGGYYSAIILEKLPIAALMRRQTTVHTVRMVTLVELTVKGRERHREEVVISSVDVGRIGKEKGKGFTVTVENRGNVHIKGKGQVVIKTKHGSRIASLPLEAGRGTILPEANRDFIANLDRQLGSGSYLAEAVITYGMRGRAVARVPFSVSGGRLLTAGSLDAERQVKLLVDPYWVDLTAGAGAFRAVPILVENEDDSPIHVSGGVGDVDFDVEGRLVVSDAGGGRWSCADWIEVTPAVFDLNPGERRRVVARVAIPKGVTGGRSAQVDFVASMSAGESSEPPTGTAGTTVILTIPGEADIDGEITGMKVSTDATDKGTSFTALFRNKGDVPVAPKGKIVVRSLAGSPDEASSGTGAGQRDRVVGEVELDEIMGVVLPGGVRRLRTDFPGLLPAGKYSAEITVSYGAEDAARAEREFFIR